MRPGSYPLSLYRGDTYAWMFTLWQDENQTVAADLTGVTVKSEIRDKPGGTLLTTLVCTVTLPNKILVKVTTAAWTGLVKRSAAWDLQLTYPGGDVVTILYGAVTVTPDVTESVPISTAELVGV